MQNNKFPRNLIEEMFNSNVTFETILHIPSLTASDSHNVSDQFADFLDDAYEDWTSRSLLKQCPALESTLIQIRDNDEIKHYAGEIIQDFYRACDDLNSLSLFLFEFLITSSLIKKVNTVQTVWVVHFVSNGS
jgi:hypothetical protein